jgi:carbonic anhydrase
MLTAVAMFDDLLEANQRYRAEFHDSGVAGTAAKGLAVLTCIDSRIDPLAMLGLRAGDAKILRNAGARATDSLRSIVLAANLLGVTRLCLVQHTDCAMVGPRNEDIAARIGAQRGVDASGWDFLASTNQVETMRRDIALISSCTLLPPGFEVGGFIFDVHSGELVPVAL